MNLHLKKHISAALIATASIFAFASFAHAQKNAVDRVVTVVNEDVITYKDLQDRTTFMSRQISKKLTAAQMKQLASKTLSQLINEKIQQQYADKAGLTASKQEVDLAIATIERNNNLTVGSFYKLAHGLETTAREKVRTELLWQKIIERRVRPRVIVSNSELDQLIEQLLNSNIIVEKEIYQIFLPFSEENRTQQLAHSAEIYNVLLKNKTQFSSIAKTTSEGPNAAEGGYLGWYGKGELAVALDDALQNVQEGDISKPIQTANGIHILYVENMRQTKSFSTKPVTDYRLIRLAQSLPQEKYSATASAFKKEVSALKRLSDVEEFMEKYQDNSSYLATKDMGWIAEADLPSAYAQELKKLQRNGRTDFVISDTSVETIYLASKRIRIPEQLKIYRARVHSRLFQSRIELAARRFIRDLKRRAYIDVRL